MVQYVKDVNGVLQYPTQAEFPGIPNWQQHDFKLRQKGYMPLIGEAEPREGYDAKPGRWHTVEQSEPRMEPRQTIVEDFDPETGEKTGEHVEMRDTEVTFDTSYIQVDAWRYVPIPVPEPVLPRQFSKGELLEALIGCCLYDQAKAIYAADMDLQIAWAGFADIDMDYDATKGIMAQYPELFSAENVLALQTYITEHSNQ